MRKTLSVSVTTINPSPLRGGWPREAGSGGGLLRYCAAHFQSQTPMPPVAPTRRASRATLPARGRELNPKVAQLLAALLIFAASPAHAYTAYISNEKGNSITVIDTDRLEALYICAGDDDAIQVLDTKTLKLTGKLPSGPDPELLALSPGGDTIYVSNENDNLVTLIDVKRKEQIGDIPVGVEPEGMAVSPDGKLLVNTSETTNMAHIIDTQTKEIVANILVDGRPRFAEFKKDGSELWVSSEVGGTVAVIDPVKRVLKEKIGFEIPGMSKEAIQPIGISITKDGKRAFVALGPANRVAVIDAQTKKVEKYLLVGQRVWHLAFTPDEKYLLTANGVSNDVSVIDVSSLKVVKSIPVGAFPWGVVVAPQ